VKRSFPWTVTIFVTAWTFASVCAGAGISASEEPLSNNDGGELYTLISRAGPPGATIIHQIIGLTALDLRVSNGDTEGQWILGLARDIDADRRLQAAVALQSQRTFRLGSASTSSLRALIVMANLAAQKTDAPTASLPHAEPEIPVLDIYGQAGLGLLIILVLLTHFRYSSKALRWRHRQTVRSGSRAAEPGRSVVESPAASRSRHRVRIRRRRGVSHSRLASR
jgi:hypothetical protein